MHKDFDKWNDQKKSLNERNETPFIKEREIWWCSLGLNIGVESNGKSKDYTRPVLILKVFNKKSFWGIALTTSKSGKYFMDLG